MKHTKIEYVPVTLYDAVKRACRGDQTAEASKYSLLSKKHVTTLTKIVRRLRPVETKQRQKGVNGEVYRDSEPFGLAEKEKAAMEDDETLA